MPIKEYEKAIKELNKDIIKNDMFKDVLVKAIKAEKHLRIFIQALKKQEKLVKNL